MDFDKEIELFIEGYNDRGEGVSHFELNTSLQKVVVPNVILGDRISAKLFKRKKHGQYKARIQQLLVKSTCRTDPKCSHTHLCGGCSFQEMVYKDQIDLKQKKVLDAFKDILKTHQGVEIYPIIPCSNPWHYRNKMEFSFSENAAKTKFLGLMIAGASRYVFNVEKCFLASFWMSDVLSNVRKWWERSKLKAYNFNLDEGHLRYLTLREGKNTLEKMVILTVSGHPDFSLSEEQISSFVSCVKDSIEDNQNLSIFLRIQKIEKKKATEFIESLLFGKPHIKEKFLIKGKELVFNISPASFFQPNTFQAELLYSKALEFSKVNKDSVVFDLYSGTGTLGMVFAPFSKKVVGIELIAQSVQSAKENIALNNISNFEMYEGDVGKTLTKLLSDPKFLRPDLVIVDPPRAGLDPLALSHLKAIKAKNVIYVSCNPKTQAENIKELINSGYKLKILQPVDQFPHTIHIENIALLELS